MIKEDIHALELALYIYLQFLCALHTIKANASSCRCFVYYLQWNNNSTRKKVRNLIGGHNGTINFVFFNKN